MTGVSQTASEPQRGFGFIQRHPVFCYFFLAYAIGVSMKIHAWHGFFYLFRRSFLLSSKGQLECDSQVSPPSREAA